MTYETLAALAVFFGVETVLLLAALVWFSILFDRKLAEAREDSIADKEIKLQLIETGINIQGELIEVLKQRGETRLAFRAVTYNLTEGLASLARKNRICRTITEPKTKREKEIYRKARYMGQSEVMVLVARDWDRKMDARIFQTLDKETLESLPLNLETAENDNGESVPNKAAGQC